MRTRLPRRYVNSKCPLIGQKKIELVNVKDIEMFTCKCPLIGVFYAYYKASDLLSTRHNSATLYAAMYFSG